jgi:asparagine synthetase B (glutamine-hydrolysing)
LNITGEPTPQPFIDGNIVCLYNGEIYNHKFIKSDGENLIPLYKKHGINFVKELDGEFAIALYDFGNDVAFFITDPFATKPLWRNGIECASYESGVGGHKVWANTVEIVKISTGEATAHQYHQWDWTQHKTSYDGCLRALENAVLKRYKPGCFVGLSSGYDSGTIASILKGKDFKCYTVIASEDKEIIEQRKKFLGNVEIIEAGEETLENAEEFFYDIEYKTGRYTESYKKDYAAKALSAICRKANQEGRKVYLSGAGADEIISDYGKMPNQSDFCGKFPDKLKEWKNFYGSCMYSYLGKEECVGGSWNIETRYPFLDKKFVQEFLWLTPELKNKNYKSVLFEYLIKSGFPFRKDSKIGFSI